MIQMNLPKTSQNYAWVHPFVTTLAVLGTVAAIIVMSEADLRDPGVTYGHRETGYVALGLMLAAPWLGFIVYRAKQMGTDNHPVVTWSKTLHGWVAYPATALAIGTCCTGFKIMWDADDLSECMGAAARFAREGGG
jgi:hypothetical protein